MLELNKAANVEIAKLVHAEEAAFQIRNRRNKRFGLWAASQMKLGEGAIGYAKTIVAWGIMEVDDEALIRRVQEDLSRHGVRVSDAAIGFELERQGRLALSQCTPSQRSGSTVHSDADS